jgi:hypothetical protein
MDAWVWILVAAAVVVVLAAIALAMTRRRSEHRTERLRDQFGPEYDRADEDELDRRLERRQTLELRPLSDSARERYATEWHDVQARFVDEPAGTLREAHRLVSQLMAEVGYPTEDFERQAADISVDHPVVVERYRAAHAVYQADREGTVPLERQRQALVDYRALFDELLDGHRERETARA